MHERMYTHEQKHACIGDGGGERDTEREREREIGFGEQIMLRPNPILYVRSAGFESPGAYRGILEGLDII